MKVTAIKTFRPQHNKGTVVKAGETLEVDDHYGRDLIRTEMAVATTDKKALGEYQNKMNEDYTNKRMITQPETEEQRSQGNVGPTSKSETPEQRTQGHSNAAPAKSGAK